MPVLVPGYVLTNTRGEMSVCLTNIDGITSRTREFINYNGA